MNHNHNLEDLLNWTNDKVLRCVSSAGYFLAANGLAATAVHFGYSEGVEPLITTLLGNSGLNNFNEYMNNHTIIKDLIGIIPYAVTLGYTNFGTPDSWTPSVLKKINSWHKKYTAAVPKSLRLLMKKRKLSKLNYIKTAAYTTLLGTVLTMGGGYEAIKRISHDLKKSDSPSEYVGAIRKNLFLIGKEGQSNLETEIKKYNGIYADFLKAREEMSKSWESLNPKEYSKIKRTIDAIKGRNPNFDYESDKLSQAIQPLIERGLFKTPEQAVFTARVIYFESIKNQTAMEDIVQVMYNRWKFDNAMESKIGKRSFVSYVKDGIERNTIFDIAFNNRVKANGYHLFEFTAVKLNPEYMYLHNINVESNSKHQKGSVWDTYRNNRLNVVIGDMDSKKSEMAINAIINVLNHKVLDRTRQATFYKNPKYSDSNNTDAKWRERGLRKTGYYKHGHQFWKYKNQINLTRYESIPNWDYQGLTSKHTENIRSSKGSDACSLQNDPYNLRKIKHTSGKDVFRISFDHNCNLISASSLKIDFENQQGENYSRVEGPLVFAGKNKNGEYKYKIISGNICNSGKDRVFFRAYL